MSGEPRRPGDSDWSINLAGDSDGVPWRELYYCCARCIVVSLIVSDLSVTQDLVILLNVHRSLLCPNRLTINRQEVKA